PGRHRSQRCEPLLTAYLALELHHLSEVVEGKHISTRAVGFIDQRRNRESKMNFAAIGGSAADVETREPRPRANGFQTRFDLLFDVSEDGDDVVPANVSCAGAGDLFRGAVEGYGVSEQVRPYQAA